MLNRVVLIGRLTKDPELRYTQNGVGVCSFTLAVDRPFTTRQGEKETDFITIVTWRGLAENCAKYLSKGRLAAADGRMQIRNFENNEGRKIYVTEVVADNVRFLESSRSAESGPDRTQSAQSPRDNTPEDPFADDGQPIDISDDDLPF